MKLEDYNMVASIHTLEYKLEEPVSIPENLISSGCIREKARNSIIVNPNKLKGDIFGYSELMSVLSDMFASAGIENPVLKRADLRLDSSDSGHYSEFSKLNRFIIAMIAQQTNERNRYFTTDLFNPFTPLSAAVRTRGFQIEHYNKDRETGGSDRTKSRLELRVTRFSEGQDIKQAFISGWFPRLNRAIQEKENVERRFNSALIERYRAESQKNKIQLSGFVRSNKDYIFSTQQLKDLVRNLGVSKNPDKWCEHYRDKDKFETFSKTDIKRAIKEIERSAMVFFIH